MGRRKGRLRRRCRERRQPARVLILSLAEVLGFLCHVSAAPSVLTRLGLLLVRISHGNAMHRKRGVDVTRINGQAKGSVIGAAAGALLTNTHSFSLLWPSCVSLSCAACAQLRTSLGAAQTAESVWEQGRP